MDVVDKETLGTGITMEIKPLLIFHVLFSDYITFLLFLLEVHEARQGVSL